MRFGFFVTVSSPLLTKTNYEVDMEEKKLSELLPNEEGDVVRVAGEGKLRRRLFDMGITPGAHIVMRKKAPFGDPIEVTVRGYELTLRKDEAACVFLGQ